MKLTPKTKIFELTERYPFLIDYLADYHESFSILRNKAMRMSLGRMATLKKVAAIGNLPLNKLMQDIAAKIKAETGMEVEVANAGANEPDVDKVRRLQRIIEDLHRGVAYDEIKKRFAELIEDVEPTEIAAMEEQLIRAGMPAAEIQRLCDVHVNLFRESLEEQEEIQLPAGHPVHTFMAENREISKLVCNFDAAIKDAMSGDPRLRLGELDLLLSRMGEIDKHYQRKENQLFPYLEKHGVTGPPKVMWGAHDDIRTELKKVKAALAAQDFKALPEPTAKVSRDIIEMVFKEDKILYPLALETLNEEEWKEIRRGEAEIGFCFVEPGDDYTAGETAAKKDDGLLALATGNMTLEQLNLLIRHLPLDISFVDENDRVLFYSDSAHRIFPRSPGVIGRNVQNCHPPKSVHIVQRILEAFRKGEKSTAEFWLQIESMFLHIRYFAVRDAEGKYRGTLEVMQEVSEIRALQGQQRLLDWDD